MASDLPSDDRVMMMVVVVSDGMVLNMFPKKQHEQSFSYAYIM